MGRKIAQLVSINLIKLGFIFSKERRSFTMIAGYLICVKIVNWI